MKKITFLLLSLLFSVGINAQTITLVTKYETNPSKGDDFALKINAPKGAKFYIDFGDGQGAQEHFGSGTNQNIFHDFADMDSNKEHTVKVWGAPFTEFMVLSNRMVTKINLDNCTTLTKFSCANSLLEELDLSECTQLQSVICNSNMITSLKVPEGLKNINFSRNSLSISKFPKKEPGMGSFNYQYGPMRPVQLSEDKINGLKVDLSEMLIFEGGNKTKSTFKWYHLTGTKLLGEESALIDPQTYTEDNGVFSFNQKPEGKIYCVVENKELPKLNNIADKYGILPIELHGEDKKLEHIHIGFAVDKFTTENLTFDLKLSAVKDNSKCIIAWGDGSIEEAEIGVSPTTIKHHFIDAKVGKKHLIQIDCADLKEVTLPEVCGFLEFDKEIAECPVQLINISGNRIEKVDFSSFKNARTIIANGCYFKEIVLPKSDLTETLSLKGGRISEIDLSQVPNIKELVLSANNLTSLDLSPLKQLKKADISYNNIQDLKIENNGLSEFVCNNNSIPMYQLPEKKNMTNYVYAPQRVFRIPKSMINGNTIDLSKFNKLKGVTDEEQETEFIWLDAADESHLIAKGLLYDEENGVFTFKFEKPTKIFCTMSSPAFPDFNNQGSYRTGSIMVPANNDTSADQISKTENIDYTIIGQSIELTGNSTDTVVEIFNINGQRIIEGTIAPGAKETYRLDKGIYIVKAGRQVFKISI